MSEFVVMENVKKTYKMGEVTIHAVDGVNIEIHKGEFAVIVGPSGPLPLVIFLISRTRSLM